MSIEAPPEHEHEHDWAGDRKSDVELCLVERCTKLRIYAHATIRADRSANRYYPSEKSVVAIIDGEEA